MTTPSNVLPLHLKQTFLPIIWIFSEGEGDGIESRLPFKISSTLPNMAYFAQNSNSAIDNWNIIAVQVERGFPLMGHTGAARAAVQNLTK